MAAMVRLLPALVAFAALTALPSANSLISTASNSTTDIPTNTSTEEPTTTTTAHLCVASNPCSLNSQCVEVGDGHTCTCKKGFSGVDSADGDGCHRTTITSVADRRGRQGLYVTVGEGADLHVRAGGELRGRVTSIFAQADALETLLGDGNGQAGLVADNAAAIDALDAEVATLDRDLSGKIMAVAADLRGLVEGEMATATLAISANTQAVADEAKRAKGAEVTLASGLKAEVDRATTEEAAIRGDLAARVKSLADTVKRVQADATADAIASAKTMVDGEKRRAIAELASKTTALTNAVKTAQAAATAAAIVAAMKMDDCRASECVMLLLHRRPCCDASQNWGAHCGVRWGVPSLVFRGYSASSYVSSSACMHARSSSQPPRCPSTPRRTPAFPASTKPASWPTSAATCGAAATGAS